MGLVSVVSLDVAHRRRELAVRLALGASRQAVLRDVLARAGWKVGIGIIVGLAGAVAATRAMRALLYDVEPLDAGTYAAVVVLVSAVVAVAAWAPARRAAGIDPMTLMRAD